MTSQINLYDYVLASLRAKVIPQRQVAKESGVPFSTVAKIAQGSVTDPSVHTVQKLYDYFLARLPADCSRSHPSPLAGSGQGANSEQVSDASEPIGDQATNGAGSCQAGARKTAAGERREVV